ncbi:hypothetical protein IQ07DRAFT_686131 [Pyrenochaeta sp. DS3sAY3a]|nr:hypothetical protein IQ07DRAFT_686131 [Pyrenochaeta sp. DS3sAY3a]
MPACGRGRGSGHTMDLSTSSDTLNYFAKNMGRKQPDRMIHTNNRPQTLRPSHVMGQNMHAQPQTQHQKSPRLPIVPPCHEQAFPSQAETPPLSNSTSPTLTNAVLRQDSTGHCISVAAVLPWPPYHPSVANAPADSMQIHNRRPGLQQGLQPQPGQTNLLSPQLQNPHGPSRPPSHVLQPWYTAQECLQVLDSFEMTFLSTTEPRIDRFRLRVLREAIQAEDWVFLSIHQIYCLLDSNPAAAPEPLRSLKGSHEALTALQEMVYPNIQSSPGLISFFGMFPYPVQIIAQQWREEFERHSAEFTRFLSRIPYYIQHKQIWRERKIPPLPRELFDVLQIDSPKLLNVAASSLLPYVFYNLNTGNPVYCQFMRDVSVAFGWELAQYRQVQASSPNGVYRLSQYHAELEVRSWECKMRAMFQSLKSIADSALGQQSSPSIQTGYQQTIQPQPSPSIQARSQQTVQQQAAQRHPVQRHSAQGQPIQQQPMQQPSVQQQFAPHHVGRAPTGHAQPLTSANPTSNHLTPAGSLVNPPVTHIVSSDGVIFQVQISGQQPQGRRQVGFVPSNDMLQGQPVAQQGLQRQRIQTPMVPLFPPRGYRVQQQRVAQPARTGLHQAHLQRPVLEAIAGASPLYHYVTGFAQAPTRLEKANEELVTRKFGIPADVFGTLTKTARRELVDQKLGLSMSTVAPSNYVASNGRNQAYPITTQQRRKPHHGKDLHIEITQFLIEGENVLEVSVMSQLNDRTHCKYLVAIEYLGVISLNQIQEAVKRERIPADEVLQTIKTKLSGRDDDEIAIVDANLTIKLFDAFSASKRCDIPVRTITCLHNDCFDLDTFLNTRPRHDGVSAADQWWCPICKADARPPKLRLDGFMERVYARLSSEEQLRTRVIVVQQDGSWKARYETAEMTQDEDGPDPAEVIDLSD